jgi:hypothetical protein
MPRDIYFSAVMALGCLQSENDTVLAQATFQTFAAYNSSVTNKCQVVTMFCRKRKAMRFEMGSAVAGMMSMFLNGSSQH